MSEEDRRLSVQEKIEVLEKSKVTLHPPVFDSQIIMSTEKKSPDAESNALETQKNSIQVIKTNDKDSVKVELSFGGKDEDEKEKEDTKMKKDDKTDLKEVNEKDNDSKEKENEETKVIKVDTNESKELENKGDAIKTVTDEKGDSKDREKVDRETDKDADTEKERKSQSETQNKEISMKEKEEKEEASEKEEIPLVSLTDAEIDEIVERYPKLHKDPIRLQKYLDFFFSVDKPRYGYFTVQMLAYKLRQDGCYISDREVSKIFTDIDANNDCLVSLDEYLTEMSKNPRRRLTEDELRDWFQRLDNNNDGIIERKDIEISLEKNNLNLSPFYIDDMFSWDGSGKGEKLNFKEFCWCYQRGQRAAWSGKEDWFEGVFGQSKLY